MPVSIADNEYAASLSFSTFDDCLGAQMTIYLFTWDNIRDRRTNGKGDRVVSFSGGVGVSRTIFALTMGYSACRNTCG